jgi:hypothetical protein
MKVVKMTDGGLMVRVSPQEALRLISSLSKQILTENCNSEREEFTDSDGKYFSIAVHGDRSLDRGDGPREVLCESYPKNWRHAVIHLNPETGEMHSDGDHSVRDWIQNKIKN